jgi:hypothetical protein
MFDYRVPLLAVFIALAALVTIAAVTVPTQTSVPMLADVPVSVSWTTNAVLDDNIVFMPNEAVHVKSIVGRTSAVAPAPTTLAVYRVNAGQMPCSAGTLMMAAGNSLDLNGKLGANQTIPLAADTSVALGTALCIAVVGNSVASKGNVTIWVGP